MNKRPFRKSYQVRTKLEHVIEHINVNGFHIELG